MFKEKKQMSAKNVLMCVVPAVLTLIMLSQSAQGQPAAVTRRSAASVGEGAARDDRSEKAQPTSPYTFQRKDANGGQGKVFYVVDKEGKQALYSEVALMLAENAAFRRDFAEVLRTGVDYDAYFFETPGVNSRTVAKKDFEFALLKAPELSGVKTDGSPFEQKLIGGCTDKKLNVNVTSFPSTNKDAILLAPCPTKGTEIEPDFTTEEHAHLASFMRKGSAAQTDELLTDVGKALKSILLSSKAKPRNFWLSTSGTGVHWLHVRVDTIPKYYTYEPYKAASW